MIKMFCEQPLEVAKEMFWLAWNARSDVVGIGILQDNPSASREDVWDNVTNDGDYCTSVTKPPGYYRDYVFGRMIELYLLVENDGVSYPDSKLNVQYQRWAKMYRTYVALFIASLCSLAEKNKTEKIEQ